MGVPAFFRWLSKKYASIIVHCVEEKVKNMGVKEVVMKWARVGMSDNRRVYICLWAQGPSSFISIHSGSCFECWFIGHVDVILGETRTCQVSAKCWTA